ncbi:MAG TPA: cache domain-containing protein [Syntrophorhabdaceae bacterium]|nr:cache domain-containing protein [Syntrophorhabdaceae bacterium]
MIKKTRFISIFFCLFMGLCFFVHNAYSTEPTTKEAKQLISLVKEAASLIEKNGEVVFLEFKKTNSKWLHNDTYIFVIDPKGFVYVNPQRSELEGTNQINLKDLMGKNFIQSFIKKVTSGPKSEGWVHYIWFKPGEENPMWKTSFIKLVKSPSGKEYIVGSGIYNMKMDRVFAIDVVDDAVNLIQKKGKEAFKELKDPLGDYNYLTTYVFVFDSKGNDLINPAFPGFEGQNVLNLKDSQGKYFIKEMINSLEKSDSAWVDYMWPKPRQMEPSKKSTYVKKVTIDGNTLYVGSGIYLE